MIYYIIGAALVGFLIIIARSMPRKRAGLEIAAEHLPNGLKLNYAKPAQNEIHYIIKEIFTDELYYQEGIKLQNGATVFDVGANVGSFAMWVNNKFKVFSDCKVLCFEPIPPTYKILSKNKKDNKCMKDTILCNYGLSSEPVPSITFTYFPTIPGNSTMFVQEKVASWDSADVDATIALFEGPLYYFFESITSMILVWPIRKYILKFFISQMFKEKEEYDCSLRTMSDVIDEQGIKKIDLLKVDVEGAELDVILGIKTEHHWKMIQQVVMEVQDFEHRLDKIKTLLTAKGFKVKVVVDKTAEKAMPQDMMIYTLYATR